MVILVSLFVEKDDYQKAVELIKVKFRIQNNQIFVLEQKDDEDELILTFNIEVNNDREDLTIDDIGKLIRIHRKKETNTLYTINALNLIIESEKNINWNKYKYCFLTVSNETLKVIKTKLQSIVNVEEPKLTTTADESSGDVVINDVPTPDTTINEND